MRVPFLIDVWVTLLVIAMCGVVVGFAASGPLRPAIATTLVLLFASIGVFIAIKFASKIRLRVQQRLEALAELGGDPPDQTIWRMSQALTQAEAMTERIALRIGLATSQLDTEQARSRSGAALLETAFRSMQDGLIVVAADGRVVLVNPAAMPLLDISDNPQGRLLEEVVRSADAHAIVAKAMTGQTGDAEITLSRLGRIVQATAVPLPGSLTPSSFIDGDDQSSASGGVVLVLHDVTLAKRADQTRREFTSNVSHELKTPVTTVRAYVDTLQEAAADGNLESETAVHFLNRIDEQAERLHELIGNLMTLAQIESPDQVLSLDAVDLPSTVEQVVGDLQILAEQKSISLTSELAIDAQVVADREGLRSIVQNLVRNAIQHTPFGGTIRVEAIERAATVQIKVIDDGVGIPKEAQTRLFDRFYRVDSARTRDKGGSGLGLAIVTGLVQRFGGTVEVQSELDVGTTFTVTLRKAAE